MAQEAQITINADQVGHRLWRYLTGACIEDVNHEVYGGIYTQMVFGEHFQEPVPPPPLKGFTAFDGRWIPENQELRIAAGEGPKLICDNPSFLDGEASVEVLFPKKGDGNAGLILRVNEAGKGINRFFGYEVSLDTAGKVILGRHRRNWEPISETPCAVPVNKWIKLDVHLKGNVIEVLVDGKSVTRYEDKENPLGAGCVGLRNWQRDARFRNLTIKTKGKVTKPSVELVDATGWGDGVSGMWRALRRGDAQGEFGLETKSPFIGAQSQRIVFKGGKGEIGIENQSLNRWGMNFVEGKPYQGCLQVRAAKPCTVFVAMESRDGSRVYAETPLPVQAGAWQKVEFGLAPKGSTKAGRFAIKLKEPGAVEVGYAFLQPGEWGRFKGLPSRKDVVEGLMDQGITVLRYGGCMVNTDEYRWKKMIGPRDQRPPYKGFWYPYSSNGWGILDFMDVCRAAGFLCVPDFNMGETPQDMSDFIEYVNGPADSEWGRKRVANGHREPYHLKYIQLGNEERVDENYWEKFKPMAEAIWAKDADITIVVGDFAYNKVIEAPFNFEGGAAVKTLAVQKKILDLAKEHNREVWFDIHTGTEEPPEPNGMLGERSFIEHLSKITPGAKYKVPIFEFNAGNHALKRALSNACGINAAEEIGDKMPIVCSANCLQPDGQNDNGWNQGLLFLNPSQVWLQPPGYVTQMVSRNYQPLSVKAKVEGGDGKLDISAKKSEDGKTLVLQVVNIGEKPAPATIRLEGFVPSKLAAAVEELSGALEDKNTAEAPKQITPKKREWRHGFRDDAAQCTFPPYSFTVIRFE
jgi:hypothetical protein